MIDKIDEAIIRELQNDGRVSHTHLASVIGVSEGTIRKRIKTLREKGIMNVQAIVNPVKIGFGLVSVMALEVKLSKRKKVAEQLAREPNVYYLASVTGRYGMFAVVLTRTSEELSRFLQERIAVIPGIDKIETFVNLEISKSPITGWDITKLINS